MSIDDYIKFVRENPTILTPQHPKYEGDGCKKRRRRDAKRELKEADTSHQSCKSEGHATESASKENLDSPSVKNEELFCMSKQ